MTTDYQQQLLLALRLRNVSGPRIAEALAEVESHVAETGEDAYQAFGEPAAYAGRIAHALGTREPLTWRGVLRSMTWRDAVTFVAVLAGSGLFLVGLANATPDDASGTTHIAGPAALVAGLALLGGAVFWIVRHTVTSDDRVLDPRTGRSLTPPFPRWTALVWFLLPAVVLLVVHFALNA